MDLDSVLSAVERIIGVLPFSGATWIVVALITFVIVIISKADTEGSIVWEDLIVDQEQDSISPYKLGFLIGIIVSTWIVIDAADKGALQESVLMLYMSYLLGGAGWSEFINKRHQQIQRRGYDHEKDPPSREQEK